MTTTAPPAVRRPEDQATAKGAPGRSGRPGMTGRAKAERKLGWMLCAPAVTVMLLVTGYPIAYAFWLSLQRYDLRFPDERSFVGLSNYGAVLSNEVWWQDLMNTLVITVVSVAIELVLGYGLAWVMHRALFGRGVVRASILVPYGIITVVAAFAWRFAFDPTTGFVNGLLNTDQSWFTERWSSYVVIIATEVWKTTPFMALLLLAGFTLVPNDLIKAARVDGATAVQRFLKVTLPLMKPAVLVALLFRTLDAFRIFDAVFVQTRGAQGTESLSILGYNTLITRLNLGLGSAVSVLVFALVVLIAVMFVKGFGANLSQARGER
ncbi:MAG TPA: sugar ABC transporter permease [Acidimicrobiales bacterium]